MNQAEEIDDFGPILEQDEEVAQDTAAPAADASQPVLRFTSRQMWDHQVEKVIGLQQSLNARMAAGQGVVDLPRRQREIQIETQIADVISFVETHEKDIRAFIKTLDAERAAKAEEDKARRRSFAIKRNQEQKGRRA